jgi:GntR family transcriptional regulator
MLPVPHAVSVIEPRHEGHVLGEASAGVRSAVEAVVPGENDERSPRYARPTHPGNLVSPGASVGRRANVGSDPGRGTDAHPGEPERRRLRTIRQRQGFESARRAAVGVDVGLPCLRRRALGACTSARRRLSIFPCPIASVAMEPDVQAGGSHGGKRDHCGVSKPTPPCSAPSLLDQGIELVLVDLTLRCLNKHDDAIITIIMLRVKVDRHDPTDLHEQVAAEIRRAIADGEAEPGERLPPARDLAAILGVNTNTVFRALRTLRDEGLLEFRRGRGVSVSGSPERGAVVARAREFVRFARRQGYRREDLIQLIDELS